MRERRYQILLAVLTILGALVGAFVTSYIDHSRLPVKSAPLQSFFMKSENVSWGIPTTYPIIVDEKGISVRDFAGITVFFYFTATGTGSVGTDSNGAVFFANNLTAYARLFLDLQPYRNASSYLFNNQGRYTLPAQYNTNNYSVSISLSLVRVTTIEIEAFLACWRCSVVLQDITVNGTLFY
jgi:hypothetical protein